MRILQMQQWMQNIQNQTLEKMVTLQLHCTRNCDLVAFCVCVCEWSEPVQNNGQFNKADFYSIANYIECRLEHVSCSCIYPITPHVFSSHAPTHSAMLQIYIALRNRDQEEVEKKMPSKREKEAKLKMMPEISWKTASSLENSTQPHTEQQKTKP